MTVSDNNYPTPDAPALTLRYVSSRRWMHRAACAHSDLYPDAWFPEPGTDPAQTEAATDLCRFRCPVWEECAAYALLTGQCCGIVAGIALGANATDNAVTLRDALAGSDLAADLQTAVDTLVETRLRRRAEPNRLPDPVPLGELLPEHAPGPTRPGPSGGRMTNHKPSPGGTPSRGRS